LSKQNVGWKGSPIRAAPSASPTWTACWK
jgi:hypothetical protein